MPRILRKTPVQFILLVALAVHVLRNADRDYEQSGRLSAKTSASAWALYLSHAVLTISAALRPSKRPLPKRNLLLLGSTTAVSGLALLIASIKEFRSFGQISGSETGQLVKSGPYRYSRNPQIVGWLISLLGLAIADRSPKSLTLVSFFSIIHRLYFPTEERHLERTFGEEYRRYRSNVPRFLGLPKE